MARSKVAEKISVKRLRPCKPSMKVPGDGVVEAPMKRFDVLGGNRSAAHYADAMAGGKAKDVTPLQYGNKAKGG